MKNFIDRCLSGDTSPDQIDEEISSWHDGDGKEEIHEYLGLSWPEYKLWVENPESLAGIIAERKKQYFPWLEEVYHLISCGEIDGAGDIIIEKMDSMMLAGEFHLVDELISVVDLSKLESNTIVLMVCASYWCIEHLKNRESFRDRARAELIKQLKDEPRVERLLKNR